jgi:hypothetical protein
MTDEFYPPVAQVRAELSEDDRLQLVGMPVGCTPRQAQAILKARVANVVARGVAELGLEVLDWIREVRKINPERATELYFQYIEFVQPRLKAAQTILQGDITPTAEGRKRLADMTVAELEAIGNGG